MQVLYLGRAHRTKETLPDFREKCRVTRHSRVFRRLTVVNGPPGLGCHTLSSYPTTMKFPSNGIMPCVTCEPHLSSMFDSHIA